MGLLWRQAAGLGERQRAKQVFLIFLSLTPLDPQQGCWPSTDRRWAFHFFFSFFFFFFKQAQHAFLGAECVESPRLHCGSLPQQWAGEHNCRAKLLEADGHHGGPCLSLAPVLVCTLRVDVALC